jgi:hypothetical protein
LAAIPLEKAAMKIAHAVFAAGLLAVALPAATADILVPDSFRDRVMRFSSVDGSLIDMNFITNADTGGIMLLGVKVQQVGSELWLSDQNLDGILKFDLDGNYLGFVVGPANNLDNVRGFNVVDNILYVCNFGPNNGAGGACIRKFDAATFANLGSEFPPFVESCWDVMPFAGRVMVSDGGAISTPPNDTGYIWGLNAATGAYEITFASGTAASNGLSLPKGMCLLSNGNLLVANNSGSRASLEYDAAGNRVATYPLDPTFSANGVFELDNGLIFICLQGSGVLGTNGIYLLDRSTGIVTPSLLGNQTTDGFIPNNPGRFSPPPPPCAADANGDGRTDAADLSVLLGQFGTSVPTGTGADFNGDGNVDAADLSVLLGDFGCGT